MRKDGIVISKHFYRHWAVVLVSLLQLVFLALLATTSSDQKVYIRNILFSQFLADASAGPASAVNALLADRFKTDPDPAQYLPYLNPQFARELSALKQDPALGDRGLALAIVARLGDPRESRICGIESLGKVVIDTDSGQGCCSDFSKAWLFYANYLGLKAREVNNLNHTTVEYWDRQRGKWKWLDPFMKMEMTNAQGIPLNHTEIRATSLVEFVRFVRLPSMNANFEPQSYAGYQPSQYAAISWRRGVNFLQVEAWDSRLRSLGLPKSLRQLLMLTAGVQPGWLVLTTNSLAFYLNLLKVLLLGLIGFFLAFDAWLAFRLAKMMRQRTLAGV